MSIIPVSFITNNNKLEKFFRIPLLGGLFLVIFSLFPPFILMGIISALIKLSDQSVMISGGLLMTAWNLFWQSQGTRIRILFIPAWVWGLIISLAVLFEK